MFGYKTNKFYILNICMGKSIPLKCVWIRGMCVGGEVCGGGGGGGEEKERGYINK